MNQLGRTRTTLPDDIALQIASSLEVTDLCALGSCSRFWRELCGSDYIWESLTRARWPSLGVNGESSSTLDTKNLEIDQNIEGWRGFYMKQHYEMADRASTVVKFLEECLLSESLEVGEYLKAIEDLTSMQLGFKDIEMFFFKPKLNVLLNLVGLHYCINWLKVPAEDVAEALQSCKISERQVCVKWWKLGRWFYGFRMRDEFHSRWISLADLAATKEDEVLAVLQRGAIHEVLRVQISAANPISMPSACPDLQAFH